MPHCNKLSLRKQLLLWLLIPQLAIWLLGAVLAYRIALHYANDLTDQSLQQSARALATLVRPDNTYPNAELSRNASTLLSESDSSVSYYSAHLTPGNILFSNWKFSVPNHGAGPQRVFYTEQINGEKLRAIALVQPLDTPEGRKWLTVQIAKNPDAYQRLYQHLFFTILIPLTLLTLATSALVWRGVAHGLMPFKRLQQLLESRKPQDISPLDIGNAPQELVTLFGALNHLLISAGESIDRQRRFIGDAAHQLRTPLAGLKSQTELAMRESISEPQRERLALVHTSATRSIHLVNQLLTLARSEPGNQSSILRVHMDLARLIRELTAEAVPRALAAGIDLGCDSALNEAWIEGNSVLLRELFVNLVENALKYIPRGGCVTVRLHEQNRHYIVEVEDDGPGIPDSDKQRVFERFYRRQQDGSGCGLGMAIVREIAERHGGTVSLRDAVPHGLIVRIELPH